MECERFEIFSVLYQELNFLGLHFFPQHKAGNSKIAFASLN